MTTRARCTDLQQLPAFEALYAFLRARYKAERFELMAGAWCPDYPKVVTQSAMDHLEQCGWSCVGQYESVTGRAVYYGPDLNELPPAQALGLS